jgi:hypothetical protein
MRISLQHYAVCGTIYDSGGGSITYILFSNLGCGNKNFITDLFKSSNASWTWILIISSSSCWYSVFRVLYKSSRISSTTCNSVNNVTWIHSKSNYEGCSNETSWRTVLHKEVEALEITSMGVVKQTLLTQDLWFAQRWLWRVLYSGI